MTTKNSDFQWAHRKNRNIKEKWGKEMKANKIMQELYIRIAVTEGRFSQVFETGSTHTQRQLR